MPDADQVRVGAVDVCMIWRPGGPRYSTDANKAMQADPKVQRRAP